MLHTPLTTSLVTVRHVQELLAVGFMDLHSHSTTHTPTRAISVDWQYLGVTTNAQADNFTLAKLSISLGLTGECPQHTTTRGQSGHCAISNMASPTMTICLCQIRNCAWDLQIRGGGKHSWHKHQPRCSLTLWVRAGIRIMSQAELTSGLTTPSRSRNWTSAMNCCSGQHRLP